MIVIAGYGFVGKAYYEVFKHYHKLAIVDPAYNNIKIHQVDELEAVVCCVSTPPLKDGVCDGKNVLAVIKDTPADIPILIKSTISLAVWQQIVSQYPDRKIAFSPEFLRAASPVDDLKNISMVILSGSGVSYWRSIYKKTFPTAKIHLYSPEEAILIKYFRNSFLATKVSFFNQVQDLCSVTGADFDCVRQGIADDARIGHSHSFVDPEFAKGWGGMCFSKDIAALLKTAEQHNTELSVLSAAVSYNNQIRK